ncbi:MAG TPA: tetratricopeptide repeat protein, partial [Fimbriimonas sp.]|nr:tetratricopeptide repeat protein [Fimbriimonas sp.]
MRPDLTEIQQDLVRSAFPSAEKRVRAHLERRPQDASAMVLLGIALAKQNRFEEALTTLEGALALQKEMVEAWNWVSICHRSRGDFSHAESACLTALRYRPNDPGTYFNLGLGYLAAGSHREAAEALEKAAAAHPQNPQLLQNLGLAHQGLGEAEKADRCFRQSIQLAPNAVEPVLSLGNLCLERGDPDGAETLAEQALRLARDSVEAHTLAARACTTLQRREEARRHVEEVLRIDPHNSVGLALLATHQQNQGDFELAAASFQASIDADPLQGFAYWGIVQSKKCGQEDMQRVPALLEIASDPGAPLSERSYLYYTIAKVYDDNARYREAMEAWDSANAAAARAAAGTVRFDAGVHRGRLEAIRQTFTPDLLKSHDLGNWSEHPIFIVGMIRSGTTLMEQILSRHPDVNAAGEMRFWTGAGRACVDLTSHNLHSRKSQELAAQYLRSLEPFASKRVTDKTPENIEMLGLLSILFPHAKAILMNRNPADNCLSIYTTPYAFAPDFAFVR